MGDRPCGDEGLDETWWAWLKGLDLWGSGTGLDARSGGVGSGWGLVRRCCPAPGTMTKWCVHFVVSDRSTCEAGLNLRENDGLWVVLHRDPVWSCVWTMGECFSGCW